MQETTIEAARNDLNTVEDLSPEKVEEHIQEAEKLVGRSLSEVSDPIGFTRTQLGEATLWFEHKMFEVGAPLEDRSLGNMMLVQATLAGKGNMDPFVAAVSVFNGYVDSHKGKAQ